MRLTSFPVISTATLLDSNWTSTPVWIGYVEHFSIYLQFTGVPEGAFSLEYSNDFVEPNTGKVPAYFAEVSGSSQSITEAGTHGWNVQNTGYRWVRIKYAYTMGTGYLDTAFFHGKGA